MPVRGAAALDAIVTTAPALRSAIRRVTARETRKVPRALTAKLFSQSWQEIAPTVPACRMPAALRAPR